MYVAAYRLNGAEATAFFRQEGDKRFDRVRVESLLGNTLSLEVDCDGEIENYTGSVCEFTPAGFIDVLDFVSDARQDVVKITVVGEGNMVIIQDPNLVVTEVKMRLSFPDTNAIIQPWNGVGNCQGVDISFGLPAVNGQTVLGGATTQPAVKSIQPSGTRLDWYPTAYPFETLDWKSQITQPVELWVSDFKIYRDADTKEAVIPVATRGAVVEILQ